VEIRHQLDPVVNKILTGDERKLIPLFIDGHLPSSLGLQIVDLRLQILLALVLQLLLSRMALHKEPKYHPRRSLCQSCKSREATKQNQERSDCTQESVTAFPKRQSSETFSCVQSLRSWFCFLVRTSLLVLKQNLQSAIVYQATALQGGSLLSMYDSILADQRPPSSNRGTNSGHGNIKRHP